MGARDVAPQQKTDGWTHHALLHDHEALRRLFVLERLVTADDPVERRAVRPNVLHGLRDFGRELDLV